MLDYGLLTSRLLLPPGPCQPGPVVSLGLAAALGLDLFPHHITSSSSTDAGMGAPIHLSPFPSLPIIRSLSTPPALNSAESFLPCLDRVDDLLLKGFIYNFRVHRCVCAYTCVILYVPCVRAFGGQNRALDSPGNGVTGSYELPGR